MAPPTINRVRGKSRERRRNADRRQKRQNAAVAGKVLHGATTLKVSTDGKKIVKGLSAKKLKKKEQRARLLGKSSTDDAMEA